MYKMFPAFPCATCCLCGLPNVSLSLHTLYNMCTYIICIVGFFRRPNFIIQQKRK